MSCDSKNCIKIDLNWRNSELYMQYFHQIYIAWTKKYTVQPSSIVSPFGWCFTFNIVDEFKLYQKNSTVEYYKPQKPYYYDYYIKSVGYNPDLLNSTKSSPLMTSQSTSGLDIFLLMSLNQFYQCSVGFADCKLEDIQTTVIVHSPYEMPDIRKFFHAGS